MGSASLNMNSILKYAMQVSAERGMGALKPGGRLRRLPPDLQKILDALTERRVGATDSRSAPAIPSAAAPRGCASGTSTLRHRMRDHYQLDRLQLQLASRRPAPGHRQGRLSGWQLPWGNLGASAAAHRRARSVPEANPSVGNDGVPIDDDPGWSLLHWGWREPRVAASHRLI